jgi:hypothetical protein
MKRTCFVYIAGPFSGDIPDNVNRAIVTGIKLREICNLAGVSMAPIIPHLFMLADTISPHDERFWLEWDFDLLEVCDCVFRLPGHSMGADMEELAANDMGIPVYTKEEELFAFAKELTCGD